MSVKHKEIRTEIIDRITGEVISEKRTATFKTVSEPKFVKMYIDDIASMMNLNATATKLLVSLATRIGYDSIITLSPFVKRQIAKEMNIKNVQTIDNNISILISHGAMMRKGRGTFMLNPDYFAKGKWQDITRLKDAYIQLIITYSDNKKTVKSNVTTGITEVTEAGETHHHFIDSDGEKVELYD